MTSRRSESMTNRKKKGLASLFYKGDYFDYSLLFIVLFLVAFGLVMVYSTSSYTAELKMGRGTYYLERQGIFAILGTVIMLIISRLDYRIWKNFSLLAMGGVILLLLLMPLIGTESHGATRWIQVGPVQFQPSEAAKLAIILYTAHLSTIKAARIGEFKMLVKVLLFPLAAIGLIAGENLSTGIICAAIACVIVFVTSPKVKQFIMMGGIVLVIMVCFLFAAAYRLERIDVWLNPEAHETGYQTLQSLYAIGSGGIFGKGLGQSIQKLGFIPESHNDYIFSVVCEELGLFGAICVIAMFIMLIWRCVVIAVNTQDLYGALIVVGIVTHIAVQVLVNIAVVTNSIPPTGVPLPFISYGGTALVGLFAEMGIVLSISRHIRVSREY